MDSRPEFRRKVDLKAMEVGKRRHRGRSSESEELDSRESEEVMVDEELLSEPSRLTRVAKGFAGALTRLQPGEGVPTAPLPDYEPCNEP